MQLPAPFVECVYHGWLFVAACRSAELRVTALDIAAGSPCAPASLALAARQPPPQRMSNQAAQLPLLAAQQLPPTPSSSSGTQTRGQQQQTKHPSTSATRPQLPARTLLLCQLMQQLSTRWQHQLCRQLCCLLLLAASVDLLHRQLMGLSLCVTAAARACRLRSLWRFRHR
jgi:hypothetical protein